MQLIVTLCLACDSAPFNRRRERPYKSSSMYHVLEAAFNSMPQRNRSMSVTSLHKVKQHHRHGLQTLWKWKEKPTTNEYQDMILLYSLYFQASRQISAGYQTFVHQIWGIDWRMISLTDMLNGLFCYDVKYKKYIFSSKTGRHEGGVLKVVMHFNLFSFTPHICFVSA